MVLNVCLIGGGNGGHVCAGWLGSRSEVCKVSMLTRAADKFDSSITITLPDGSKRVGAFEKVSADPADVVPGSDVVILCGPVWCYPTWLRQAAPHLKDGAMIGTLFAQGGFDLMARKALGERVSKVTLFGFTNIPFMSRIQEYGKSAFLLGFKKFLNAAISPRAARVGAAHTLQSVFGNSVNVLDSFLNTTLTTSNQIIHPGRYYGLFHDWDGKTVFRADEMPMLYRDMDQFSADCMEALSNELIAVRDALAKAYPSLDLSGVLPLKERVCLQYGEQVADQTDMRSTFRTNRAYAAITTPMKEVEPGVVIPDVDTRLFLDDVPYGLVILKDLSMRLNLDCPTIDRVLLWHQKMMNKTYLVDGKLSGPDVAEAGTIANYGFRNLDDLVDFTLA